MRTRLGLSKGLTVSSARCFFMASKCCLATKAVKVMSCEQLGLMVPRFNSHSSLAVFELKRFVLLRLLAAHRLQDVDTDSLRYRRPVAGLAQRGKSYPGPRLRQDSG